MFASIGRIVHFVDSAWNHRAAIVTGHNASGQSNLQVMADGPNDLAIGYDRPYWVGSIPYDSDKKLPGTWHWPEFIKKIGD